MTMASYMETTQTSQPTETFSPANTSLANISGYEDTDGNDTFMETYPDPFARLEVKTIFIILYGIVFLMCFVGNLMVLVVVLRHRKMRTITNFFLANLAVADLCVGIFCVLPNLSLFIFPAWILGKAMCKLYYFIQSMSYAASVNILTIISVERFFAIIYPLRSKQLATMCLLRLAVLFIWIIAGSAGIPYLIIYDTFDIPNMVPVMTFCLPKDNFNPKTYVTAHFLFGYVIPLCLMTVMYSCISAVLWRSSQKNDAMKAGGGSGTTGSATTGNANATKPCYNVFNKKNVNGNHIKTSVLNENFEMRDKRHVSSNDSGSGGDEQQTLVDSANRRSIATRLLKRMDSTLSEDIETNDDETETEVDYEDDWPGKDGTGRSFLPDLRSSFKLKKKAKVNGLNKNGCHEEAPPIATIRQPVHVYTKRLTVKGRQKKQENALVARRRVIRLLLAVIISFALCVLPYHIRVLWQNWSEDADATFANVLISPITMVIYYLNSGLNPLLYAFLSDRFRQCFVEVMRCTDYRVKRQYSVSNKTSHSVA